jgi:hypothetical protein
VLVAIGTGPPVSLKVGDYLDRCEDAPAFAALIPSRPMGSESLPGSEEMSADEEIAGRDTAVM